MIWQDILIVVIAIIVCLSGVVGSFLPVIPGPPISYGGMLLLQLQETPPFSTSQMIMWLLITAGITTLDYIIPSLGTKKLGGSKYGIWGSTDGMIVGLFFGPVGIILGPAIGAFAGELIYQKDAKIAGKAALGSFIGFVAGTLLKLIVTLIMLWLVVWNGISF